MSIQRFWFSKIVSVLKGLTSPDTADFYRDIKFLKKIDDVHSWKLLANGCIDSSGRVLCYPDHVASFHRSEYTLWALSALGELRTLVQLDLYALKLGDLSFLKDCPAIRVLKLGSDHI